MSMAINPTSQMLHVTSSKKLALIHRSLMPLPTSQLTMRYETTTIGLLPQAGTACPRSISMATAYLGLCFSTLRAGRLLFDLGSVSLWAEFPHLYELQHPKPRSMSAYCNDIPSVSRSSRLGVNQPWKVVPIGASSDEEAAS